MITPYRCSEHVQGANESTRDMYADRRPDGEDMAALRGGWQERGTRRAIAIPSTRGETGADSGSALAAVSSFAVVSHSVLSLELIDNRVSKLRVRYDQAFLPSTTSSVATTAYLLRATSRRQQARLGYGVCGRRRDPGRDCSQNLTGKICVSELEPRNLNSATSKSRDLDQTTFLISSGLNTIKRSCFCHHWMNE